MVQEYFDQMAGTSKSFSNGRSELCASVVLCIVSRMNPKTRRREFLLVRHESGGNYLVTGQQRAGELGVQAARREILEKTGIICVDEIACLLRRDASDLPGYQEVAGVYWDYWLYGVEISYIQSTLWEKVDGKEISWASLKELLGLCRVIGPTKAELVYQGLRKLGYQFEEEMATAYV